MSLARRARSRSIPRDAGPGDDEIQAAAAAAAAASRVVDITPWVLPLLLTVIVYAKQPPLVQPPLPPDPPLLPRLR